MTKTQVEVVTSVQRRRRWTPADKERIVAASLEPGAALQKTREGHREVRRKRLGWFDGFRAGVKNGLPLPNVDRGVADLLYFIPHCRSRSRG